MSAPEVEVAGRYRLLQRIGAGGMGVVWRGYDERLGRDVAVKRLLRGPGVDDDEAEVASHRAMREARITARLHHPHAVPVYDVVEHEGQPCLVMEYFPSSSLADLVAGGSRLSVGEVARIGSEVASALAAAHRVGIVHRDVKPANVLVGADGAAKISDFGISHAMGDVSLTSTGLVTGTPAYLAPEVARGEPATAASDVFSLGATLYTVLEGRPPFGWLENPMAMLHRVASGEIEPPARSGALTALLVSMLSARPQERPSMPEVARRLFDGVLPDTGSDFEAETSSRSPLPPPEEEPAAQAAPASGQTLEHPVWPFGEEPPAGAPETSSPVRRRGPRLLLALLGLAIAAAVVLALVNGPGDEPDTAGSPRPPASSAAPGSTAAPTTAAPSTTSAPSTTPPPSTTPAPSTSAPRPSPTTSSPPADAGAPSTQQLRDAVAGYYALLPGDRDAAWDRLTPRYQRTTASSRSTFESFWSKIDSVRVSDLDAGSPDTVTATLTYDYADGRVFVERTRYRLAKDDGILKIDRSDVLSSVQR